MPPKALYTFSVGLIIVILETKRLFEGGGGEEKIVQTSSSVSALD